MAKQSPEPVNQLDATEHHWFAVRTRSKCEKMVCDALQRKKIHAYVPLQQTTRRYTRKIKHYNKPLITCYIFVKIVKAEYVPVLETENVAGFIKFDRNLLSIPEEEINLLRRIVMEPDIELEAMPGAFDVGDPVSITAGPLTGMSGLVVKVEGRRKLQIELQKMGYSLLLTIDAVLLEKSGLPSTF
jgi:transcriptional antiterminator RfaH